MSKNGKVIQIFLPSGNPKGIKKVEIKTDKVEVIQCSRKDFLENRDIFDFMGIYCLVDSLQEQKPQIYIGKGQIKSRLSSHNDTKDFWNTVFAIRLKTEEGFNDSHLSFMENYFIDKAKKINQCFIEDNKQTPKIPKLEESIICEIWDYIKTIEILFSTLGLKVFQEIVGNNKIKSNNVFYCRSTFGAEGSGEYTEDGFIVFKGALCRKEFINSAQDSSEKKYRDNLIKNGILKEIEEDKTVYILTENHKFSSPSLAGSVILARFSNGWISWKNEKGETLDAVYRKNKS
ncbi:MAG: GIY-YIG nuclease family protein [Alphaproteobacteria bacterium]